MSRPRQYARLAEQKRQPLDDDDSERFDWQDVEQTEDDDDEPDADSRRTG